MEEIVNKVKESGLISMDLANYKPNLVIQEIDLTEQLWQGLILKEKDFRAWIKETDWTQFQGKAVFVHCSADAIVPTWAYMLVASQLTGVTSTYIIGSKGELTKKIIEKNIDAIDLNEFNESRVIIKGCSDIPFPDFAMACLVEKLQPVVKSIMYGEPCSTVPVFKRK
jgi:hypothetical protein|tara:strand:+ start:9433 stop:9936 length:504 start_codon:yes stop_codon:yes gene_type:complete